VQADRASRHFNDRTEWELDSKVFNMLCKVFGTPDIDLFASRLNHKVDTYFSWQADPYSVGTDAFLYNWRNYKLCFAFSPFSLQLVLRVLQKTMGDEAKLILILIAPPELV
jgi:hypothetical protein